MSRKFIYEIDENNLSFKLKSIQLPINEEAWQKFEKSSNNHFEKETISRGIQFINELRIPLTKKALMSFSFAGAIILFATLLFNFVSIKPSSKKISNREQTVAIKTFSKKESKQKLIEPVQVIPTEVQQTPVVNEKTNSIPVAAQPIIASATEQGSTAKPSVEVRKTQASNVAKTSEDVAEQIRPAVITEDNEDTVTPDTP